MWNIIEIQLELWPGLKLWLCVHCDLGDMTFGLDNNTPFGIHAICPGGTEKSRKFDPLKYVPCGTPFSCKIYFVPDSLWPVICTPFSGFWSGQLSTKIHYTVGSGGIITVSTRHLYSLGEVFRQYPSYSRLAWLYIHKKSWHNKWGPVSLGGGGAQCHTRLLVPPCDTQLPLQGICWTW